MCASGGRGFVRLHPPARPIAGDVFLPGSKSITNRALIAAALARGASRLENASHSDDAAVLIDALSKLGIACRWERQAVIVEGRGGAFTPYRGTIDVGAAGTAMRFLAALCCFVPESEILLQGTARMHERPIGPLVAALRTLGADIRCPLREGFPPLLIRGKCSYRGGRVAMQGDVSSQFFTSLLLAAPLFEAGLEIEVQGVQASPSYIDVTGSVMRDFGVNVENRDYRLYRAAPAQGYAAGAVRIEGDASGASYFWGAAALGGGRVRVHNLDAGSPQGDVRFAGLLARMGCGVEAGSSGGTPWLEVRGAAQLQ